jgi:2-C-methyl-D-erythritol 4-phosphate cytidylyltransferase
MNVVAFVTAADRAPGELDVLSPVHGQTLLTRAVRGLLDAGYVDLVVVVAPPRRAVMFTAALRELGARGDACRVVEAASLWLAIEATEIPEITVAAFDVALVHDGDRAFTPPSVVRTVVDAVRAGAPAVVPVLPMADTVKLVDETGVIVATQDRELLRTAQTPLGFTPAALRAAVETGEVDLTTLEMRVVEGHPNAMRVTTPFGLVLADAVLAAKEDEESL